MPVMALSYGRQAIDEDDVRVVEANWATYLGAASRFADIDPAT
jgi:hypothetical protein